MISVARSSGYCLTISAYASKPVVARPMNSLWWRSRSMMTLAIAFARAMSEPTSMPSHTSAHRADSLRRGSTQYRRAPL